MKQLDKNNIISYKIFIKKLLDEIQNLKLTSQNVMSKKSFQIEKDDDIKQLNKLLFILNSNKMITANDIDIINKLKNKWETRKDVSSITNESTDDTETTETENENDTETDNENENENENDNDIRESYKKINPNLTDKEIDDLIINGTSVVDLRNDMNGGGKIFRNPDKRYRSPNFKTSKRPFSPSPKRKDYEKKAVRKSDGHSRCTFILPNTNQRCKILLGIYPQFCHLHTMLIENLVISKSKIKNAGNGLFAGPHGFKKGMIIGEYSKPWMEVSAGRLETRNGKKDTNYSYVYCDEQHRGQKEKDVKCWDGLDARSTIIRNANDAHGSKFKNNAYFDNRKDSKGNVHAYMIASKNIGAFQEIYCDYNAESYWGE